MPDKTRSFIKSNSQNNGFIIGGSPSTGSSLLRQILNRHSQIVCAPETHLFCKPALYTNWNTQRAKLLKMSIFGLSSNSLLGFVGLQLEEVESIDHSELADTLKKSENFPDFVNQFFKTFLGLKADQLWGEKTPCNSNCFKYFLSTFETSKVIHITRNPYDTIASLKARGLSITQACSRYLFNTSNAINLHDHPNYKLIKYEDLVLSPEGTIKGLMAFLNLQMESTTLQPNEAKAQVVTQLHSWNHDETATIGKKSLDRFSKLIEEDQYEIKQCLASMKVNIAENKYQNFKSICEHLAYSYKPVKNVSLKQKSLVGEKWKASMSQSPYHFFNYPITII